MLNRLVFLAISILSQSLTSSASPEPHLQLASEPVPYLPASILQPRLDILLGKRQQGSCQANHISCASLSAPEACCPVGTSCARDSAGTIACCPYNNVCVGMVGGGSGSGSSSAALGSATGTTNPTTAITATQTAVSTITAAPYPTYSNGFYPFPLIPATYSNSQDCLSAYTICQQQSTSCYAALAGQNGVTVNALGGGGVTQAGYSGIGAASASSVCNSLSVTGCRAIQSTQCAQFGSGNGNAVISNGGPRETGHAGMRYAAAFGVVGAMGLAV